MREVASRTEGKPSGRVRASDLTVLVPAYNEAASIGETIRSLREQTTLPGRIVVIDDCSTDGTGDVARNLGVEVMRPPVNSGSKAAAQTFALRHVDSGYVMTIDADTALASDAIETLAGAFDTDLVAAASGFVIPRHVSSVWERGRYIEYLYSFSFHKQVQDHYSRPLIASGCFSMYRTTPLRQVGGWSNRTMAEDMDLTWSFYEQGFAVRFVPRAVCYPIEPRDLHFLGKQLRRWSHGFIQNVRLHWRGLLGQRYLRSTVGIGLFDALVAPPVTLLALPLLGLLLSHWFFLGYVIDLPVIAIPVLIGAAQRRELRKALVSLPAYFPLRFVNSWFMLRAVIEELILGRRLSVYEKGH